MAEVLGAHAKMLCGSSVDEHRRVPRGRSLGQISAIRSFRPSGISCSSSSDFNGLKLTIEEGLSRSRNPKSSGAKMSLTIGKAQKWWDKGLQPNMREVESAQDLVDSLQNAGDKLVVVDFFSPSCGGCKALHPKICQLAEMNPDVQFLQVNYEELKSMCYSLRVHVLPFFRFYRGSTGRLCSFSCTIATIKKFKDALAKYNTDLYSVGPPKGLEEKELLALAANKDLGFSYVPKPEEDAPVPDDTEPKPEEDAPGPHKIITLPGTLLPSRLPVSRSSSQETEKSMVSTAV